MATTTRTKGTMTTSTSVCDTADNNADDDPVVLLPHLEKSITVLYHDSSIIVINKPSKLRSVPGHANNVNADSTRSTTNRDPSVWQDTKQVSGPPPMTDEKKRCYHETWAYALQEAAEAARAGEQCRRKAKVEDID